MGVTAEAALSLSFVEQCQRCASEYFSLPELRPSQRDVLELLHTRQQVLAMMPTGSGKTLLYALPSLVWNHSLVVVVCPLIALMKDQVRRMDAAGVSSVLFTSDQSEEERRASVVSLRSGQARLVFVSPERFVMPSFQRLFWERKPQMVVVDEAHCVVSWGHGFRPEYQLLEPHIRKLAPKHVLALTATASTHTRAAIREHVFSEPHSVVEYLREPLAPNILVSSQRVFSEDQKREELIRVLNANKYSKAIVYFSRRDACEAMARSLKAEKRHAVAYHAGLGKQERSAVQTYLNKTTQPTVVCATQAFGMGVDLPDVDLVVVLGFPANLEEMFQMFGRAGRRGTSARACLIWSGSDPKKRQFQFEAGFPNRSKLEELLNSLQPFWQRPGSRSLQRTETLKTLMLRSGFKPEKEFEGFYAALRYLGVVCPLPPHSDILEISLADDESLNKLLLELPHGPTQRRVFLEALAEENQALQQRNTAGIQLCFSVRRLQDLLGWSVDKMLKVLEHYQPKWRFKVTSADQVFDAFVFVSDPAGRAQKLASWSRHRSHFFESLAEVERFANAKRCRLLLARDFFLGRRGGATADPQGGRCGRCDLCAGPVFSRKGSKNPEALCQIPEPKVT